MLEDDRELLRLTDEVLKQSSGSLREWKLAYALNKRIKKEAAIVRMNETLERAIDRLREIDPRVGMGR